MKLYDKHFFLWTSTWETNLMLPNQIKFILSIVGFKSGSLQLFLPYSIYYRLAIAKLNQINECACADFVHNSKSPTFTKGALVQEIRKYHSSRSKAISKNFRLCGVQLIFLVR